MKIYDFVDEGLGHSSYLIDVGGGMAALIDPPRFPAAHEALAAKLGLKLAWTVDTHSHADYVTGSPALAARTGAHFIAPALSALRTSHKAVSDLERIELAKGVTLTALETPGHTPDHYAFLLASDGEAKALFSGGSLMVGAVGRTDLCGQELAEPLARQMFRSLRRFDELPDELPVYPTHGAGSFCSGPSASARTTTLGSERKTNALFRIADEHKFVSELLAGFGTFPAHFRRLPEVNRIGPQYYDDVPSLELIDARAAERQLTEGGLIIDARPVAEFAAGAAKGSISNALRPVFGSWLGWLVEPDTPLIFILGDRQDREELVRQCLDVGHENLIGELDGGIHGWKATRQEIIEIPFVNRIDEGTAIIDVRQQSEYRVGHIPGAINVELGALLQSHKPEDGAFVMCGHGERAMTGASLLMAKGYARLKVFDGGPGTWSQTTGKSLDKGSS